MWLVSASPLALGAHDHTVSDEAVKESKEVRFALYSTVLHCTVGQFWY